MRTKIPGLSGTKRPSRNTSKIPRRRFRAPRWCFRGLRTRRTPRICGASSSSSDRTARRNDRSLYERRRIEQTTMEIKQTTMNIKQPTTAQLQNLCPKYIANVLVQDALVNPPPPSIHADLDI